MSQMTIGKKLMIGIRGAAVGGAWAGGGGYLYSVGSLGES